MDPKCGPMDAICKPIAIAPCTSDIHTVWEGAIGDRHNMILGHECCGEIVQVGELVKDFKPENVEAMAERVLLLLISPDLRSKLGQKAFDNFHSMHTTDIAAPFLLALCREKAGKPAPVSVIVPNYNYANYLERRLASIFEQSFRDIEVIVLDDASTDQSLARIVCWQQRTNL